jgi:hypothetical protein
MCCCLLNLALTTPSRVPAGAATVVGVPNPLTEDWVEEAPHEEWPGVLLRTHVSRS